MTLKYKYLVFLIKFILQQPNWNLQITHKHIHTGTWEIHSIEHETEGTA